jgi:formate hydrogenlyase subunit 6/NADH:ubiquinone oxidoreductase subunit I
LRCINCGYCAEICPKKSLAMVEGHGSPAVTRDREFH